MKKAEVIYRIVQDDKDDVDMTRAEAVRIYQQLRQLLWPRVHAERLVPKKETSMTVARGAEAMRTPPPEDQARGRGAREEDPNDQ